MTKKETEEDRDEDREIEIDMGIVSLGGVFDFVNKIVELGTNLKDLESKLRKYRDEGKVRADVDIRVSDLIGDKREFRISSGTFFKRLDELAKERRRSSSITEKRRINLSREDLVETEFVADVIEHEDRVYVLTQVPYEKDEIQVTFSRHGDAGELIIEAPKYGYKRLIPINVKVDEPDGGQVQWNYNNHIVEAVLSKAKTGEECNTRETGH